MTVKSEGQTFKPFHFCRLGKQQYASSPTHPVVGMVLQKFLSQNITVVCAVAFAVRAIGATKAGGTDSPHEGLNRTEETPSGPFWVACHRLRGVRLPALGRVSRQ
jgi:hypothetical protein